ncbi:transposase [Desulfitobacterium sp. THU1]|uniref:transposase n=1 Tax=Desulfitobacterium sp. THU1 TaxID=3138072 RepID=UPI0031201B4E
MAKYSPEFKLEVIKSVLDNGISAGEASRKFGVHLSDVSKRIAAYEIHGINAIKKQRITYSGEFKQKVIEDMQANHLSFRETAAKYNLCNHNIVAKWERIYMEEGSQGLYVERRGRANSAFSVRKGRSPKLDRKRLLA